MQDTGPDKLKGIPIESLEDAYLYLSQELSSGTMERTELPQCERRLAELRGEIELKRIEIAQKGRHTEIIDQGSDILLWTKRAVAAAIVVPIVVVLMQEMLLSKPRRAKSSQSQSTLSTSTTPTPVTPIPTERPTASPTPAVASPTPE